MNKHFDDARYYLKRAGEHAKLGLEETAAPYATRVRSLVGRNPEPTRLELVRGRARSVAGSARASLARGTSDDR
ncbi:DUF7553 family protein [Natronolimnohabitans innermongolicus]|uniref:Uncharacterized protein n=1 Tax=Natronolimnohabitans innermongolicus JCM 12255 TaxID=1227499 RepID=L9X7B3_9EURY|nr:hypothetical protein [Natronolimnohabitans innermongolicus]ELY57674.1 hypothetical protein C493_07279 [Natronolimnohabitans innermongolicus JCM 12255]